MTVKKLIEELKKHDGDKEIFCQVTEQNGPFAWNMFFELNDMSNMIQLNVYHPELKNLPKWE